MTKKKNAMIENKEKEEQLFTKACRAAEKGDIRAMEYLMAVSPKTVYPILARMAKKEDAEGTIFHMLSRFYLNGIVVEKDLGESMRLLEISAEKQCTRALHDLGIIYEYGKFGIEKDFAKAIKYYEKGAALDDATCMTILGVLLVDSDEIPQNESHAFQLFSRAASKGDAMAYDNLGNCYKFGIGTEVNLDKATECYAKAAELKKKRTI